MTAYFRPLFLLRNLLLLTVLCSRAAGADTVITTPPPPQLHVKAYLLMDYGSGRVLAESNAEERLPPASLTKILASYVVFRELGSGRLKLSDLVTISENAWRTGGSKTFVKVHDKVSVEELLKGMIIQSGNDASYALAEHIAGGEDTFADLMNQHAQRLGMSNSNFKNSMGLPDPDHYTTAHDLALVTRAMIKEFPEYYKWHAIKEFTYNGIKQHNRNLLLWRDDSVDGVKTGHTEEAGYCLVTSAVRDGTRLIAVVLGGVSTVGRASASAALLNYGYRFFESHLLYSAGTTLAEGKVRQGKARKVKLGVAEDLYVSVPRRRYKELKAVAETGDPLVAPFAQGIQHGFVKVMLGAEELQRVPMVTLDAVEQGNWLVRAADALLMWIH